MGHIGFFNKASKYKEYKVLRIGIKIHSVTYEKLILKKHNHNFLTQIKFDFFFQPRVGEEEEKLKLSQPLITQFLQVLFFFDLVMTFLCQDIQECLVVSLQYFEVRIYILDSLILFSLSRSASVLF